jgi:hypothetical protein
MFLKLSLHASVMAISSDSTLRSFRPDTFALRVLTNASSRSFSQIHPLTGTVSESLPLGFTFVWETSRRMGTWSLITSQSLQTFQQGTLVLVTSVTSITDLLSPRTNVDLDLPSQIPRRMLSY